MDRFSSIIVAPGLIFSFCYIFIYR
uniref:Uncharacterized protein n=1 Tax=Rhizophora mucronata TaxID=61149 RepID=A0A2P2NCM9_RHIMU